MQHLSPTPLLAKRLRPLARMPENGLILHEIYASVQGESTFVGLPCTFVRTTACHLRCTYCDTRQAFGGGNAWSLDAVVAHVKTLTPKLVLITGGEPLLQPNALPLMTRLCDAGYTVCLETSGALDIGSVDPRVHRIVDIKTPDSGEQAANCLANIGLLQPHDEVKFVLGSADDYAWANAFAAEHKLAERCTVLYGPIWGKLDPQALAHWIVRDGVPVRLQVQLHKYIWSAETQGV